jgi:protein required for attachment to host cells
LGEASARATSRRISDREGFVNNVWVLVCDAAKARIFEIRQEDPAWHVVDVVLHEGSRRKASELVGGRSGSRSSEGRSVHHNALAPASSPKEVEKDGFAHTLATTLDQAMRSARFGKWVLVAPPHFLGLMRKELTSELEKHLLTTVDKDFNDLDVHELSGRLRDAVRVPDADRESIRAGSKRPH